MKNTKTLVDAAPRKPTLPSAVEPIRVVRAYELLASQPGSLIGLDAAARSSIIVTAIADERGREHVVSRFGDEVWNFESFIETRNTLPNERSVTWPADLPPLLVADAKAAMYVWWKQGRPGWKPVKAKTLLNTVRQAIPVLRYLADRGVKRFADVRPIHIASYVEELRAGGRATGTTHKLRLIDVAHCFALELQHPLRSTPWGPGGLQAFCGVSMAFGSTMAAARTLVIPPSVQASVFCHAESTIAGAKELLDARDRGEVSATDSRCIAVRDAIYFVVLISTGMRASEAAEIRSGACRTELREGVHYYWIRTREHKTGKGEVDFLAPPEALEAIALLERLAAPWQEVLRAEMIAIEHRLAHDKSLNATRRAVLLQRHATARASASCLFLASKSRLRDEAGNPRVNVLSCRTVNYRLVELAKAAGVEWRLASHQCRRTFAWNIAQSRLGRRSLIFLKWQFKHTTMSMTELYAASPIQDEALYDEFLEEIMESKVDLITSWFDDDTPLAGGAGRKIIQTRAIKLKDRASLLRHTAEPVTIRATAHGWCLAEQQGCVGEGMYEASRCVDCGSAVIDPSYRDTWIEIHAQNLELLAVNDCGPGVRQRAEREIAKSARVLTDLGVVP